MGSLRDSSVEHLGMGLHDTGGSSSPTLTNDWDPTPRSSHSAFSLPEAMPDMLSASCSDLSRRQVLSARGPGSVTAAQLDMLQSAARERRRSASVAPPASSMAFDSGDGSLLSARSGGENEMSCGGASSTGSRSPLADGGAEQDLLHRSVAAFVAQH